MGESDRTKNVAFGIAIVIIIILIAFFLIRRNQSPSLITVNSPLPTPVSSLEQDLQNNFGITVPTSAQKADLKDITGGSQMGLATLDKVNGQNEYTVIANLEDPQPGFFYQAWIVNGGDYVSLGKLTLAKGGWLINYNTTKDLSDHKSVWVTLEKVFDNTPETHVLEGSF
jgi:Anti-sigma-K factor rskA, C-terminal